MTALNFLLMVVNNMRPAVTDESVRYSVYICFKVLFLQIFDIYEPIKQFFKLQTSELIYKMPLVGTWRLLSLLVGN